MFKRAFKTQFLKAYLAKWFFLSVIIGIASGLAAILFYEMLNRFSELFLVRLAGYRLPLPLGEGEAQFQPSNNPYILPLVTGMGGLLSGLLVFLLTPEAEGDGADAAIDAFHNRRGEIRGRVPLVKMVASAITIGSGGSAGRERPIALTSAGIGSIIGRLFRLAEKDRRIAVAVGMGAGIGAIFKAPFGGAILAAEILYLRDFEVEVLIPSFMTSVIAYSVFSSVYGWQPIFSEREAYVFSNPLSLVFYAFLGILCGVIGIVYVKSFYGAKSLFDKLEVPRILKPAIGGLLVGLIGMFVPHVLGTGYGWLQKVILGDFSYIPPLLIFGLIFLKILATSLTVGSGGSGGVFAPALVIGGMTGAATWLLFNAFGIVPESSPAPYVIVGMMSFFGGVGKVPIAVILMVSEMTGTYNLIVPSMLSTTIAYFITGRNTIYRSQVPSRSDSPAHMTEYTIPFLTKIKVKDAMSKNVMSVLPNDAVKKAAELMVQHEIKGLPVVRDGELVGIVTFSDVLRVPPDKRSSVKVEEVMSKNLVTVDPEESLLDAFEKMIHYQVGRLPVIDRKSRKFVGIITRGDIGRLIELKMDQIISEESEKPF